MTYDPLLICLECGRAMGEGDPGEEECQEHGVRVQRVSSDRPSPWTLGYCGHCGEKHRGDCVPIDPRDATGMIIRRDDRVRLVGTDVYGRVTRISDDPAAVDVLWDDGRCTYSSSGALRVALRSHSASAD